MHALLESEAQVLEVMSRIDTTLASLTQIEAALTEYDTFIKVRTQVEGLAAPLCASRLRRARPNWLDCSPCAATPSGWPTKRRCSVCKPPTTRGSNRKWTASWYGTAGRLGRRA